jgi:hypothetical protein
MANIRLKELVEANVDPKLVARSKESGKLVYFKTPQAKDAALKSGSHLDPKAEKGGKPKADAKPNDMFGGDYAKDRGGNVPKVDGMATVNSIAAKTGLRAQAVAGWADENGVNLSNVSADIDSKKLKPMDLMTAISGNPGNKYAKDIISKYSQSGTSDAPKAEKSKYDDNEYWKDDEYSNTQGYIDSDDEDSEEDDDYDEEGSDVRLTSDRLSKVETALEDDLNLRGNGFETTRESSGGGGGWEGPMTIVSKDADYNDEDNFISLSVGSPNNDGKFSIVFANSNGEPYFEPNYDALTGDIDLEPQQAYKVTKALMKMPEIQKLLKGEIGIDEFQPIYDKLKSKFSKKKSSKLTSMLPKDATDGPKINGKDQTTPNRMFDKKKPFDPKEIEKDVTDMLKSDGYEVEHQWGTNDYFLNISKKDKKGKEVERYTVQKNPKTGMADVWDAIAKQWVVEGEPSISRLYDTIGQIPDFRED